MTGAPHVAPSMSAAPVYQQPQSTGYKPKKRSNAISIIDPNTMTEVPVGNIDDAEKKASNNDADKKDVSTFIMFYANRLKNSKLLLMSKKEN